MRILKSHPILSLLNSYIVDSPQPSNISYLWNMGSLLGLCLIIQIISGIFLAMHYTPNVDLAFVSVEHIMRDVNMGWAIRYCHSNTASFFFIFVYLHIARGLYYGSYRSPRILPWSIGVIILVIMMATGFLGYINSLIWITYTTFDTNPAMAAILPTACSPRLQVILSKYNITPVAVYENLDKPGANYLVSKAVDNLAGIYVIVNLTWADTYVGSGITGRLYSRYHKHLLSGAGNKHVWNAVKKYGLGDFAYILVENISDVVTKKDNRALLNMEDKYMTIFQPKYNVAKRAGNTFPAGLVWNIQLKHELQWS